VQADASLNDILKFVIEATKTLEDLAVGGYGSSEKMHVQHSKNQSYAKGDPKSFRKLRWVKRKLLELAENIYLFIEDREDEIKGPE